MLQLIDAATRPDHVNLPGFYWHPLCKAKPAGPSGLLETGGSPFAWDGADAIAADFEDYH